MSEELEQLQKEFETYKIVVNWLVGLVISHGIIDRELAKATLGALIEHNDVSEPFDVGKLSLEELNRYFK